MRRASGDGFLGNLGPGISRVRSSEQDLRAARDSKSRLAGSWTRLAVPPTWVGRSRCTHPAFNAMHRALAA